MLSPFSVLIDVLVCLQATSRIEEKSDRSLFHLPR
jgi:hypothetical protein